MVIFAVIMPLVVLVILGFIYGTKPAAENVTYTFMEQSFGALCTISICAGGLMGLPLSLIHISFSRFPRPAFLFILVSLFAYARQP